MNAASLCTYPAASVPSASPEPGSQRSGRNDSGEGEKLAGSRCMEYAGTQNDVPGGIYLHGMDFKLGHDGDYERNEHGLYRDPFAVSGHLALGSRRNSREEAERLISNNRSQSNDYPRV